jgi:hypothetical protein
MAAESDRSVVGEKDVYRSAKLLIDEHQGRALEHAVERAAEVKQLGDATEAEIWLRIIRAIVELSPREAISPRL